MVLASPGQATESERGQVGPNFTCNGTFKNETFKNVRVLPGDTCVLIDSLVTGNFRARRPRSVSVLDTEVQRNLMVRGATHDVVIGNRGCRFDPVVGNNIKVSKSHNVAICFMTTKNNIQVTANDGRISLFHNNIGRNLDVSRNEEFVRDAGENHKRPGAIRIRQNVAGGHVHLFNNHEDRGLLGLESNSPAPVVK